MIPFKLSPFTLKKLFTGYEVHGLDHLPDDGPALLIFYHGTAPVDVYYVWSRYLKEKQRVIHSVGDNFMFNMPGEFSN